MLRLVGVQQGGIDAIGALEVSPECRPGPRLQGLVSSIKESGLNLMAIGSH